MNATRSIVRAVGPRVSPYVRELLHTARSRSYARLRRAMAFPIAVIAAPPGYGKSAVVRDFLALEATPYRLVRIAPGSTGLLAVLRAFAECCADIAPAVRSGFAAVYDRLGDAADGPEQLAAWMSRHLAGAGGLFVLDGLDDGDDARVGTFVGALVDATRDRLRWTLVGRSAQHLPIARWLAEARLDVPVDAADLALSEADLRLGGARLPDPPDDAELSALYALCGGWPAATALAFACRGRIDPRAAPDDDDERFAFLAEATRAALSPAARAFVDRTCLFGTFDAALLECAGLVDVEGVVHELCDGFGILIAEGAGGYAFEGHFRRRALDRLRTLPDGAFRRAAAACAAAYELDGRYAAMVEVFTLLGDEEALCALLTSHGFTLIDRGEADAVQRALAAIPHDILLAFPGALAVKASLESLGGKIDVAEAWFRLALGRIGRGTPRDEIVYRFGVDLVRRERPDAIELLEPVVATIDHASPLAAPLMALLATAYASQQQPAAASLTMDRALRLLPRVEQRAARAKIVCQAGYVALALRDVPLAKAYARRAYDDALAAYSYDVAARALSILYNIALDDDDDVAAARSYLALLADASGRAGSRELLLYATLCRYEIEVHAGDLEQIAELEAQLSSLEVFYSVLTTETLLPAQALQATWNGDFERAFRLLESTAEDQITPARRAYRYAEMAVYAAAAGLRGEALAAADRAFTLVRPLDAAQLPVLTARTYIALAFVLLGRRGRAAKLLRELEAFADAHPRMRCLVDAVGSVAARWQPRGDGSDAGAALARLEDVDFGGIARMLEALPLPAAPAIALDADERRMLRLLGNGVSTREIALRLRRSVASVDAQLAAICRKLDVSSRRQAVARAFDAGLLAEPDGAAEAV